ASYNWYNANRHFSNNLFFGEHPEGEPFDPLKITADPLFANPGSGGIGLNTVEGYQLREGSPALGTGRSIPDNGGRDYFGNPLIDSNKTDIGIHQRSAPSLLGPIGSVQISGNANAAYVNGLPV